ncbi:MAG: B12-binding domain-containing radical SAM protein [Thermodesulfobacteriota bacterium]
MFHVKHAPHVLLVNPWITDFGAYNFWVRPLGLLYIAGLLRRYGFEVTFIDCLDFLVKRKEYRDGKFYKLKIEKPKPLHSIRKNYSQYGIPEEIFREKLSSIGKPDAIGITSGMTYWYPGVFRAIMILREFFRETPILLGGIYSSLCHEHAKKYSGADYVLDRIDEVEALKLFAKVTGTLIPIQQSLPLKKRRKVPNIDQELQSENLPYPCFDLYPQLDYTCIMTSRGCPFRCSYCASPWLSKRFLRRDPFRVVDEIEYWSTHYKVHNIAFYDDALLIDAYEFFIPMVKEIIRRGIQCNFHTPNGLHIREIDQEVADLLFRGNFKTIRLGLETSNKEAQLETGGKVENQQFQQAVKHLRRSGYSNHEIGVYIMAGLPGQRVEEVEESIEFVRESGAKPYLVEYSPIPQTPMFEKAKKFSSFDLENEPLFHNNSLLPCQWEGFTMADYRNLKLKLKEIYNATI